MSAFAQVEKRRRILPSKTVMANDNRVVPVSGKIRGPGVAQLRLSVRYEHYNSGNMQNLQKNLHGQGVTWLSIIFLGTGTTRVL